MAKGEYAVVGGTTRKIKKEYAVVGGQTRKIKKKYAVIDGKTRLVWSGSEFKLVVSPYPKNSGTSSYPLMFSDDGSEWETSTSNTYSHLTNIVNVDGVLFGIREAAGANPRYYWYLYKSTDNGATWTEVTNQEGTLGKYILRYLNGKLFVIGSHHSSSSYKNFWYSSDLGETWTSGKYKISDGDSTALSQNGAVPFDLRYGVVSDSGQTNACYFFMIFDNLNRSVNVYQSRSHEFNLYAFTRYTTFNSGSNSDGGAMSIRNGVVSAVVSSSASGSTYCFKRQNGNIYQVKTFSGQALGTVASNSEYIVGTCGTTSFKFDGNSVTQGGTITNGYFNGNTTFASTFVNGTRVFAFKAGGSLGSSTSDNIMYSDNYGETWTNLKVSGLNGFCQAMCSTTDSFY